ISTSGRRAMTSPTGDQPDRQRVRHTLANALMLNAGATPLSEAGTRSGYEGSSLRSRSVRNVCALSYQPLALRQGVMMAATAGSRTSRGAPVVGSNLTDVPVTESDAHGAPISGTIMEELLSAISPARWGRRRQ